MPDTPSTPRNGRAASAPPSERPSNSTHTSTIKAKPCELTIGSCSYETQVKVRAIANAAPATASETDHLAISPRATPLPAIHELAEPGSASPDAQMGASPHGQEALGSFLASLKTEDERAAACIGWAHAAKKGTNNTLVSQFSGKLPELVAANKGWKTWKMVEAHSRGLQTFWCEKAPECVLDQYLRTDSRPCVSNYFGRNKRNTARIPNMVTWCRKHYQRSGYRGPKNPSNNLEWPREKAGLILEQLDRNEKGYFDDTEQHLSYTVSLKKSEQNRLNYHNNHQGQSPPPDPNAKSFEAPIAVLLHIFQNYVGEHKTFDECRTLVQWAEAQLSKETCPDLPLWEMVPEYPDFEDFSGDEEEQDDDDDVDMGGADDDDGPVTPRKRSPNKASLRKATPKKKSTPKSTPKKASTLKHALARSPLATHPSSAKKGRVTAQGSIQKPE